MPSSKTKWVSLAVLWAALLLPARVALCADVDAKAEVAAALYAASATQAAAERFADTKLRAQRKAIEQLQQKVRASVSETTSLRSELAKAQEEYVAELAQRDRAYSQEIAVFRRCARHCRDSRRCPGLGAIQFGRRGRCVSHSRRPS